MHIENLLNLFKKKTRYNDEISSPEARVVSFIYHWYEQWSKAKIKMGRKVDFDYWSSLISDLNYTHFAAGSSSGYSNSFCSTANHDPTIEKITGCEIEGNLATVFTEMRNALGAITYYVYDLKFDSENGWKITTIHTLLYAPMSTIINTDRHESTLAMSSLDARFMDREDNLNLNENILFQETRTINTPSLDNDVALLERIGNLQVNSGIVGIADFGHYLYDFEPLQKKVKPGSYPVEIVTIHAEVAGIRVMFSDSEQPVKWYAANTQSGNGVYGVDYGNLAIFDVGNLMTLSHMKKERIYDEWCLSGRPRLVSMTSQDDCVISPSGLGDGAYPAFWGVNKQDEIVSLYIDFMILVQEMENGVLKSI